MPFRKTKFEFAKRLTYVYVLGSTFDSLASFLFLCCDISNFNSVQNI